MNDPIYTCTLCNFSIHNSCSKLPRLITHPSHSSSGFSYHFSHCSFDLHTHCASLPLTVTHASHPHPLSLSFLCSLPEKGFACGICLARGSSAWLYNCSPCRFAAHLHCAGVVHPNPPAVSRSPATGVPVRSPTALVRPPSQVISWGAGLTVPGRPMGQGSSRPIVGSLPSSQVAVQ